MSQIDKYFYKPNIPLYHYTSIGALEKIAKNRTVWASHIYYLNDLAELRHARDVLIEMIDLQSQINPAESGKDSFMHCFKDWLDDLFASKLHNIFIFSMSEEQSLLSQWRSYTPHGKGVSIAFTPYKITDIAGANNFRLGKCLYDSPSQHSLLNALLLELKIRFENAEEFNSESCKIHFNEYTSDILQVLSLIKHKAFKEEQEWRLISGLIPTGDSQIDYRLGEGTAMLVPYKEIALGDEKWIFDNVTVGPTPHENLASTALLGFLNKCGVCRVVMSGDLPYRKW